MQREASQEPVLRGAAAAAHTPLQPALDWLDGPPDMGAKRAPTSTPWTMRGCLVFAARYSGPRQFRMPVRQLSPDGNIWCRPHSGRRGLVAEGAASHGLIIRLIIQTIRRDPTGSDQIDDPSNVSRPDPSGADQIDAEHQATDLAVLPILRA